MEDIRGYEIQKTILFETGHGIALGCAKTDPEKFKVWSFTETASGRDYYRGSCPGTREAAEEMFRVRVDRYCGLYRVREKTEQSVTEYYRYYSTQRPIDIATYPEPEGNHPLVVINYDEDRRRPVAGGELYAWGELTYPHPLTQEQMDGYELKPAPQMPGGPAGMQDSDPNK